MNYHNIFIRNLAKSLKASRTPATDYVSARNAYAIYQGNPRKTESEEVNVDSTLSETEAQLHQSLERCKSIYGLIENSTKDFESEVKMIERIFNKYNALAKNLSQFDFAKKMSLIADEFKEEEMEKPKKHKPKSKPYVLQDRSADDEAEREEREFWRDLHTCTARTLSGEKPMYHRLLGSKSEQQYEEEPEAPRPVFQPVEDNDYPDPEETDSTYLAADSSTGIAENRPHQIRADTMDNAVSGMSTMTADEASEKSAEDSASDWDSESSFSQPTVPFITSEIHRDNMRRNKQDDSLSTWSKRADHERSRVENLFRTRYAKLLKQAEDKGNLHAVEEESESSNADEPKRRGGMSRKGKQQVIDHGQRAYVHMETTSQRVYMSPKCDDDCKKEKEEEQGSPSCKKEDVCKKRPPKPKCRDPNVPEPCTIIGDTPKTCQSFNKFIEENQKREQRYGSIKKSGVAFVGVPPFFRVPLAKSEMLKSLNMQARGFVSESNVMWAKKDKDKCKDREDWVYPEPEKETGCRKRAPEPKRHVRKYHCPESNEDECPKYERKPCKQRQRKKGECEYD